MTENLATVPAVWVLIFDRYPVDAAAGEVSESKSAGDSAISPRPEGAAAFHRLDLESTCFEQFILQDVQTDAEAVDIFGGESAFVELAAAITAKGQTASLVGLTTNHADTSDHADFDSMQTTLHRCPITLNCVVNQNFSSEIDTASDKIEQAFSASLVWLEARIARTADSATAVDRILNSVFLRLQHHTTHGKRCPVLLVTFRTGDDCFVREPLICGIAENRIHVPLWIRPNAGHACRVQALAGSFDLLPTIATFLASAEASEEVSPPDVPPTHESGDLPGGGNRELQQPRSPDVVDKALSSAPRSLAFLCGAPQVCPDRLLTLRGDGWKAARTEEFLLVVTDSRESLSAKTESDGDSCEEPSRRLYVKPEDRFNVNDVSGTYATTAESLANMIQ